MKPSLGYVLLLPVGLMTLALTVLAFRAPARHGNPCPKLTPISLAQAGQVFEEFLRYGVFRNGPQRDLIIRGLTSSAYRATLDPQHPAQSIIPWPVPISRTKVALTPTLGANACRLSLLVRLSSNRVGSTLFRLDMLRHPSDHWRVDYWGPLSTPRVPQN